MKNNKQNQNALFLLLLLLAVFPTDAQAYLDPGSGSYVIQALLAGVLGAGYAVKVYWLQVQAFFAKTFGGKSAETVDVADTEEK